MQLGVAHGRGAADAARLPSYVGYRRVDTASVTRHAPLHAAVGAAGANARLPQHLPPLRRVEAVDHAGLLPRHQHVAPAGRPDQERRGPEVEVGTTRRRAVRAAAAARRVVDVARRRLTCPDDAPGLELEGHHRVARAGGRMRVVVAGRDIQHAAGGIDGRRRPHAGARRAERVGAHCGRTGLLRLVHQIRLPRDRPVTQPDGGDAAAKGAAHVRRIDRTGLFPRRRRHEREAVVHGERTGQARRLVRFDADGPVRATRSGINGIDPADLVAEDERPRVAVAGNRHRGPYGTVRLELPVHAAGLPVERLHRAGGAADEQRAPQRRRRSKSGHVAGESERPLQLEPRQVRGAQARALAGLKPGVVWPGTPAAPAGAIVSGQDPPLRAAHRARRQRGFVGALAEKGRQGLPLRALERVGHAHHRPEVERAQDAGRRHLRQRLA